VAVRAAVVAFALGGGACSTASTARTPAFNDQASDAGAPDAVPGVAGTNGAVDPRTTPAPGLYVTDGQVAGTGACAGTTLATLLDEIRVANPALAAVTTLYDPTQQGVGDGSFIYAYQRSDGGFAIVFKVGSGDCPSGCTDNDYSYFSTDAACVPVAVGHFHAAWGTGTCLETDGTPMWNHPPAPDPLTVCGADNAPQDLRGSYMVHATGQRQPCQTAADATAPIAVDAIITMTIDQDPNQLANATVTFLGTGHPLVDGIALPGQVQRRRFYAALQSGNLPNICPRTQSVTAQYDFENYQPGGIDVVESGSVTCDGCKGFMAVILTNAGP
jgi:hypothetical protein